jgi:hypothetical protein
LRVQIHANCRIRRVYFSDRLYSEDELPAEFKLYLPVSSLKYIISNFPRTGFYVTYFLRIPAKGLIKFGRLRFLKVQQKQQQQLQQQQSSQQQVTQQQAAAAAQLQQKDDNLMSSGGGEV